MPVIVRLSSTLTHLTNGIAEVAVEAGTVDEALAALDLRFPGIRARLCDPRGRIKLFIHVFVGTDNIHLHDGQATRLKDGDQVEILPAIAGGRIRRPPPLHHRHQGMP